MLRLRRVDIARAHRARHTARDDPRKPPPGAVLISAKSLSKRYGDFAALDDVSVDVEPGSPTALLGPSGSGKSTLARALAVEPKVLLLDEPFGALDATVRRNLRAWLGRLHDKPHVPTIFVTHDQEEAMALSDQIVVINTARSSRPARRASSTSSS